MLGVRPPRITPHLLCRFVLLLTLVLTTPLHNREGLGVVLVLSPDAGQPVHEGLAEYVLHCNNVVTIGKNIAEVHISNVISISKRERSVLTVFEAVIEALMWQRARAGYNTSHRPGNCGCWWVTKPHQ